MSEFKAIVRNSDSNPALALVPMHLLSAPKSFHSPANRSKEHGSDAFPGAGPRQFRCHPLPCECGTILALIGAAILMNEWHPIRNGLLLNMEGPSPGSLSSPFVQMFRAFAIVLRMGEQTQATSRGFNVLAKPIGPFCNLNCKYCYYLEKAVLYPHSSQLPEWMMPENVLEEFIRQYIQSQPSSTVSFAWQGGEPTLLGADYFRKIIALQRTSCPGCRGAAITALPSRGGTISVPAEAG